jgi:hypothetical protein
MLLAASAPALADGSIAGGVFTQSGNNQSGSGGGVLLSTTSPLPILPATLGLTGFVPLAKGGGYAVTADGTFSFVNNAIGIGYGVAKFGSGNSTGTVTAFLLHKIAPFTSVELRAYVPTGANGATAGFLGLRFSL